MRSFVGPLVLTFVIAVFVLLMQFLWRYIDDLVGKGLEFSVIAELLMYASATFVPMALPIAVLFASIMTMGNFGEKYELVAMKAGGISVRRIMMPMTLVVLLLTGVAFYFANNVMPSAMLRYRMTLYDITHKKPAVNIRPGEYYKEIEGYVIRVGAKGQDGCTLEDVVIYDHSKGIQQTNVIVAKSGLMQISPDNRYLVFSLNDGYSYIEPTTHRYYRTRPLTSIGFDQQIITFDISAFAYSKSGEDLFKGSYQMMNISQLDTTILQLEERLQKRFDDCEDDMTSSLRIWRVYCKYGDQARDSINPDFNPHRDIQQMDFRTRNRYDNMVLNMARSSQNDAKVYAELVDSDREFISRHYIEWHRKFTLSVACLLLFLIGAPFGSIVRKGGLGLPLVASVGFFVLYYMIGMIGEKAVRESAIGPEGMWISTIVLLPIGILLTLQATTDSSFFDASSWKKFFARLLARKK